MKEVKYLKTMGEGLIAYCVTDSGGNKQIPIWEVRAALIPPQAIIPGYYLLLGQRKGANVYDKEPLLFIKEYEGHSQGKLMRAFIEDADQFFVKTVYVDQDNEGFYRIMWDYIRAKRSKVKLEPAPYARDSEYGKALLRDWWDDQAIDVPLPEVAPTLLRQQMREMVTESEEEKYPAFRAMRFIVNGFIKRPHGKGSSKSQQKRIDIMTNPRRYA